MFGHDAIDIWQRVAVDQTIVSTAPDGRSSLTARFLEGGREKDGILVRLDVAGPIGRRRIDLAPGVGTEILWRPDSQAFLITTSAEGINGLYDLISVHPGATGLEMRNLSDLVRERFGQPVRCDWPEPPNVAGIGWLPNGIVLAAAQILHHSVCDSYGTFRAYEIDPVRMQIVAEHDQIEAKRRFGSMLGWEIANAPDRCIRRPEECTVAGGYSGN